MVFRCVTEDTRKFRVKPKEAVQSISDLLYSTSVKSETKGGSTEHLRPAVKQKEAVQSISDLLLNQRRQYRASQTCC